MYSKEGISDMPGKVVVLSEMRAMFSSGQWSPKAVVGLPSEGEELLGRLGAFKRRYCHDHEFTPFTQCPDKSDFVLCADSVDCETVGLFRCYDNQTCIHPGLVCDGHHQCRDGSDEDQMTCSNCGRGRFYPQVAPNQPWTATFKCAHRYTERPICATPCDGQDDLCLNNIDEENCASAVSFVSFALLCSGILAVAVTATEILKRLAKGPNYYFETSPSFTEANQGTSVADDVILDSLTAIRYKYGLYVTSFWANRYYDALLRSACGDSAVADRLAFSTLGTNRETMVLFDALDRGLLYRLQAYVELRMPRILSALLRSFPGLVAWLTLLVVAKVALYYADLAKDVFLVAQLKSKLLGDAFGLSYDAVRNNLYPLTILALMAASLAATEVLNFLTIVLFVNSGSALRKMLLCLSTPLLVGFGVYSAAKRALKVKVLCNGSRDRDRLHESLRSIRYAGYEEDRLHSLLLANENLLEHFVQSALLAVVLLAEESPTRAVQTAGNILVDGSGYAAVALSACSLVRGHVAYIAALKRGHLSNLGQAILALYFLASIATRMWAIVVCLTPLLGLLGSLDFARLATIPSSKFAVRDDDGTVVGFAGSRGDWEEPFHISGLSELFPGRLAASSYSGVAAAVLASHVAAALALHGRFFCRLGRWQLLYTFVCPPLFVDWEEIYRTAFSETVSECWRKSRTVHAAFVALIAWQNLVMCVPLAIYRGILWRRADQMLEGGFLLLPEEENSISFINWLLAGSVVLFAVFSPLSQMFFSVVYFKHGHPWSRILRREANVGMLQLELPRLF